MKFVSSLFILVSLVTCFYGQKKVTPKSVKSKNQSVKAQVKINPTNPTVYIDFVKVADDEPFDEGEPRERIYLKLVNNSKWSIYVPVFSYIDESKGNGLYYDVEILNESKPIEREIPRGDKQVGDILKFPSELKSGKSVNFSIPSNRLANNLMIRIDFFYDWVWSSFEDTTDSPYPEIKTSVYFTHSMLEKLKKK